MPYKRNKDARASYQRYYRKNKQRRHPLYYSWLRAKIRARKEGLEFDLPLENINLPATCPILGIELRSNERTAKANSYSMDRLDNTKGYTSANVRVISYRANTLKSNMSIEQAERLVAYMKGIVQ